MQTIILATRNPNKVVELSALLPGYKIVAMSEVGIDLDIEETGATFAENAMIKARALREQLVATGRQDHYTVVAEDSGLCVDALDGRPGVFTARYRADICKNEHDQRLAMLAEMKNQTNRAAQFVCVIACILSDGTSNTVTGMTHGKISSAERGENGFAFDQIFESNELGKTFAEATAEEKDRVSHRGRAAARLSEYLRSIE